MSNKPNTFWYKIIVVVSLLLFTQIIAPFLKDGLFLGHDSQLHTIYLVKFEQALRAGQFPVRWIDWFIPGFNQPLFNFYQPGIYYLYQLPRSLGLGYVPSLNIVAIFLWSLSALLMYLFASRFLGKLGGILASYLYLLAPYHIEDIFIRSALPEFAALSFVPGIFWGLKGFADTKKGYFLSLTSLFTGLTILSHPPTFIMFSPLILGFVLYNGYNDYKNYKSYIFPLFSLLIGFGLISFFLIPAFFEQNFIQTIYLHSGYYDFHHHFVCLQQVFMPFWGYGTSQVGCDDKMPFQLGLVHWLGLGLVLSMIVAKLRPSVIPAKAGIQLNNIPTSTYYLLLLFLGVFLLVFYLLFSISQPIWETLPYLPYIQYSWRFLAVLSFIASFLTASIIPLPKNANLRLVVFVSLMILTTLAYAGYLKPASYATKEEMDFGNKILHPSENLKNFDPEPGYMPSGVQVLPPKDKLQTNEIEFSLDPKQAKISNAHLTSTFKEYQVEVDVPTVARLYTHYYPGWKVMLDGVNYQPNLNNIYGYMDVNLPSGKHDITLKFENTPLRTMANVLSILFIAIALLLIPLNKLKTQMLKLKTTT